MRKGKQVLVIGGGVAGLAAAADLSRRGYSITLIEARDRLGGRVFTRHLRGWPGPVELGAEFIHGGNAAFWRRLKKHRVGRTLAPPRHWFFDAEGGTLERISDVEKEIGSVTGRIDSKRMRGSSFADFLKQSEADLPRRARMLAEGFVEGFEAAPLQRMSATAAAEEALDPDEQYFIPGGYARLIDGLERELREAGVEIVLGRPVRRVRWKRGEVEATAGRGTWRAEAAVITLPLGVLQAPKAKRGAVSFSPPLGEKERVIAKMQMGHVVRLTLRLDPAAWTAVMPGSLQRRQGGLGFIHSRLEGVPVWWGLTRAPVLTGWAGGPAALKLAARPERGVVAAAVRSLAQILGVKEEELGRAVVEFATHNWTRDPFSRGAYSFTAVGQEDAGEKLAKPVAGTLFFAGEATADGSDLGTVHGALATGLRAAAELSRTIQLRVE